MSKGSTSSNIKFPGHNLIAIHSNSHNNGGGTGGSHQSQFAAAGAGASQPSGGGTKGALSGNQQSHNSRLQSSNPAQLATKQQQPQQPSQSANVDGISQHPQQKPVPKPQQQFHLNQYQLESQQRQHQQHHQKLLDKNLLTGLPPRYQPPPQPQHITGGGILKNNPQLQSQQQQGGGEEDNKLKQPPEVEELSNLYLTGSKSLSNISSRIVPPKKQLRANPSEQTNGNRSDIQVQIHPPPRIPTSSKTPPAISHPSQKAVEDELNFLQRQQQLQLHQHQQQQQQQFQAQEMLKFVRKSDSGQPSPSSSGGGSGSGRIPTDQNRHLQVRGWSLEFKPRSAFRHASDLFCCFHAEFICI